jgi:selenide,water dikinase
VDLAAVLCNIRFPASNRCYSGIASSEDAGIYVLNEGLALLQSVDFFTPIVDDPYIFGAIAASNALSDIYAMGGKPLSALALACFPKKGLEFSIMEKMVSGGVDKLKEADVCLLGGHTVADQEIKFGFAVTGSVHPHKIIYNSKAKVGDSLLLTKALGIGVISTGIKKGIVSQGLIEEISALMCQLNRTASEQMVEVGVSAATDITGFGLLGHCYEMSRASGVTFEINLSTLPVIDEALGLASQGIFPAAVKSNLEYVKDAVVFPPNLDEPRRIILLDPQTSGGLLIAAPLEKCSIISKELTKESIAAALIGRVIEKQSKSIIIR